MMYGYGMGWFGYFTMALFWVVLIAVIVYVARRSDWGTQKKQEDEALTILRERYAKGEINKEEFEERRRVLQ